MSKVHVTTTINDESVEFLCTPEQTLLEVLREDLSRTGTKEGCSTGDCGACSVLLNGRLVCSCLVLAVEAADADVTTIEGIADGRRLASHSAEVSRACRAAMRHLHARLHRGHEGAARQAPGTDEETIRYWLAGNLCRCTGYDKIIRAVQDAATELAHEA